MKLEVVDGRLNVAVVAFNRLEEVPARYDMPDWVEEEDKKSREKKQTRSKKSTKSKKERNCKSHQRKSKKESTVEKIFSRQEENSFSGEVRNLIRTYLSGDSL